MLKDLEELVAKEQYFYAQFRGLQDTSETVGRSVNAANIWLAQYYVTEDTGHLQLYKLFQYLVTARAYLVRSEAKKAEELLLRIQDFASHYRRPADIAEAEVLYSALLWAQKSRTQAQELLEKALERMQPYASSVSLQRKDSPYSRFSGKFMQELQKSLMPGLCFPLM